MRFEEYRKHDALALAGLIAKPDASLWVDLVAPTPNQAEKIGIFEDAPPAIAQKVQMVLRASQAVVDQIGPATEPRRAPPTADLTRMTFLVSDGLYFGEAASDDMYADRLGGPVMGNAAELLSLLVDYTLQRQAGQSGKSN